MRRRGEHDVVRFETARGVVVLRRYAGVMDPSPYSRMLADSIASNGEESALDMGSGCGLQAILMARCGITDVVAVDADSRAVLATEFNALLNDVSEWTTGDGPAVSACVGSLFQPVPGRCFDLIVSNPPTFPSRVKSPRYTKGGEQGRQFLDSLIRESREHLNAGGTLQFVQSSLFDLKRTVTLLADAGYTWKVVAERIVPFRPFYYVDLWYFREEAEAGRAEYSTNASGACAETLYVIAARS